MSKAMSGSSLGNIAQLKHAHREADLGKSEPGRLRTGRERVHAYLHSCKIMTRVNADEPDHFRKQFRVERLNSHKVLSVPK